MIQRIVLLLVITGAGHGFTVIALKILAQKGPTLQVAGIGEIDSIVQLILGLIGFGMQTNAIRDIAIHQNWKEKYAQAQSARISLSLVLMVLGFFYFLNPFYLCFLLSPLLATSGEYALYAKGFPIVGSFLSLARNIFPLLLSLIGVYYWPEYLVWIYIVATTIIYLITNIFISLFLKVKFIFKSSYQSILLYVQTAPLGIINLCFYFFGLGIFLFAKPLFHKQELVIAFLALKFYFIYKGVIRVSHQAFISQMIQKEICLKIDQLCIILSILLLGSVMIFPKSFISILFGSQFVENQSFFQWLGLSALFFSLFNSANTRALLEKKDFTFMKISITSVVVSLVFLFSSTFFFKTINLIALSILLGEFVFSLLLAISFFDKIEIWNRVLFLVLTSTGLVIPQLAKFFWTDDLLTYVVSFIVMGLAILLFSYKIYFTNSKVIYDKGV